MVKELSEKNVNVSIQIALKVKKKKKKNVVKKGPQLKKKWRAEFPSKKKEKGHVTHTSNSAHVCTNNSVNVIVELFFKTVHAF